MERSDRLDSWKAIARYLGRSVRTARRWESREGLPVHRQMHRSQGSVYAFASEIDAWQQDRAFGPAPRNVSGPSAARFDEAAAIAVLPLAYLGRDSSNDFLADGLTEEIITDLAGIRRLRVISRTSAMALKGTRKSAGAIARLLAVDFLLEGTLQQAGERLRISLRLIDPDRDEPRWSARYESDLDSVFEMQTRIAREVAAAMQLELTAEETRQLAAGPEPRFSSWQTALQARRLALRWNRESIDRACDLLRKAIEEAPDQAVLHAALGHSILQYREAGIDLGEQPLREAEHCANRVLELEPHSAVGHRLGGWIHYARAQIDDAVKELELALTAQPDDTDALALLANCHLISGRVALARPLIDRLLVIDPLTPLNRCMPGWADALEGRWESAIDSYRAMLAMDPENPIARLFYCWILVMNRKAEEARRVAEEFPDSERSAAPAMIARWLAQAASGEVPEVPEEMPVEIKRLADVSDTFSRLLASTFAMAGDRRRALHWLSAAVDRGFVNYDFLAHHDPSLASLRGWRPFEELLNRLSDHRHNQLSRRASIDL